MTQETLTGAESVEWDLSDLYPSVTEGPFVDDMASIVARSEGFRQTYKGTLAQASTETWLAFLTEYAGLLEVQDKLVSFAYLRWSVDTEDPETGRILTKVRETTSAAATFLVFVSTEVAAISETAMETLLAEEQLAPYRHWLHRALAYKPHLHSEDVEAILAEKVLTSRTSWVRLFDELLSSKVYTLRGVEYSEAGILTKLYSPDRSLREDATKAFTAGLKEGIRTRAYVFNTILADHALNTKQRRFASWVSSRNLDNEVDDATVDILIASVVERYDLLQRFFRLKAQALGYDVFHYHDRYAPLPGGNKDFWTWEEARDLIVDAYTAFHPEMGRIATMFFNNNWIDAPMRKGKNGGAYSAGTVPSAHPYVFMNYTGTTRDVQVLAHELGHGIHQYLSRRNGMLLADTPLTVAETASVFGEMLVFQRLLARTTERTERLSLIVGKLDDILSTVSRQVALNRFEDAAHRARVQEGELSVERLGELWVETQSQSYGDAVLLAEGFSVWWSYISHFAHAPGYVYAYAFGELLVLALYEQYKHEGDSFPDKYMELLASGGSKSPNELLAPLGMNIADPNFWKKGLRVIEALIEEAESLL
ncbi:MAG: M3 family oligoendopeptidase [Candidatus Kapabacteria bacterium]|jgi:oligoendopeptidase F|nr:M3 family oligoendopeptidase [Candidatus Kapabacteria bacterium]